MSFLAISTNCWLPWAELNVPSAPPCWLAAPCPLASLAGVAPWHWLAFAVLVLGLLTLDLSVFHRHSRAPTMRESARWTVVWCLLALAFNAFVWWWRGPIPGAQFLTGYVLEWSLSMDNVFIFAVLLNKYFRVPLEYQYRLLFWGIFGAIVMRLCFVLVGAEALKLWDWILPAFGVILVWQALKMMFGGDHEPDPERTIVMRVCRRWLPLAKEDHGARFVAREGGRRVVTPLLLVLIVIEWTDVVFAVDSVPAIFGVTRDPFIVFTSNIFAILGLRALYFLLAGATEMFRFLKYGLSGVLLFIGGDMIVEYVAEQFLDRSHVVSQTMSLAIVLGLVALSVVASLAWPAKESNEDREESAEEHGKDATS